MPHVMHVIAGLTVGGAETMLFRLLAEGVKRGFTHEVVSMTDVGPIGTKILELGITVSPLNMPRGVPYFRGVSILFQRVRQMQPDIVETWMFHADLMSGLTVWCTSKSPVIWNIRQTGVFSEKALQKLLAGVMNPLLSYFVPA